MGINTMMDIRRLKELAGINEGQEYRSHYFIFKYYDKWYLYPRSDSTKTSAAAKNTALYKAAEAFKEIYNSSKPILMIKKEMAEKVNIREYPDYLSYYEDMKKLHYTDYILL